MAGKPNPHRTRMIDDYKAGIPVRAIAKHCGCSPEVVARQIRRYGAPREIRQQRRAALAKTFLALKAQGLTYRQIGKQLGYAETTVSRAIYNYRKVSQ